MHYLNDIGAKRVAHLKLSSGLALIPVQGKKLTVTEDGDLCRKFKAVNHGQVHFIELPMDAYSFKHPADVQPIALDEVEPIVFVKMCQQNRGCNFKVELCRDGSRAYIQVSVLYGVNPLNYSYAINHIIDELLRDAAQNMRLTFNTLPQIH